MPVKGYESVNLPTELYRGVRELIEVRRNLGYRSVTEFVAESVRLRIQEIEVVGGLKSLLEVRLTKRDKDIEHE